MIKVKNISVMNLENAFRGMRNPLESWNQSDSYFADDIDTFIVGEDDLKLALKLIKAGTDHSKFLRQIFISMDITAPLYWYKEFDTYKIGTVANSTSTMHRLTSKPLTEDAFSFDYFGDEQKNFLSYLNSLIDKYKTFIKDNDKTMANYYWRALIQNLPMSFNYTRTWSGSYENLRNMNYSREFHKLEEWRDFCKVIKDLPYSELITVKRG